jgi:hypothetical protein
LRHYNVALQEVLRMTTASRAAEEEYDGGAVQVGSIKTRVESAYGISA